MLTCALPGKGFSLKITVSAYIPCLEQVPWPFLTSQIRGAVFHVPLKRSELNQSEQH